MSSLKAKIKPRKHDISGPASLIYSRFWGFLAVTVSSGILSTPQGLAELIPLIKCCSVFFQGASVVWAWFTPITPAPCPSPSSTCPSTSTGSSSGRALASSSSASSSVVTASGKGQQQSVKLFQPQMEDNGGWGNTKRKS